ncbi:MAG TPA: hypothetical protein VEU55_06530 [Gemmatimonadales bacterium]|nr:hypothetical protein [Gemmatimonadales bacterium]
MPSAPKVTQQASDALIDAQVRRDLAARLLGPQLTAQIAHIVAIASLVVLLRRVVAPTPLAAWAVAVVVATSVRAVTTWRAGQRQVAFGQLQRRVRLAVLTVGLAWGLGAATLLQGLPPVYGVLILAVFGTFVAGASGTLVADPVTFRLYSLSLLGPQAAGMLVASRDEVYLIAVFLILSFTAFMWRMNAEAHRALVEHVRTAAQLREALSNVKALSGLLPICASCKKIRDDRGYWNQIEVYIRDHSEADFSHGLCPDCLQKLLGTVEQEPTSQAC